MSARIYQFPEIRRQVAEEFRVSPEFRSAAESLVAALADFRAEQERARRTGEQLRWYGRHDPRGARELAAD